jgi:hypothetical protein
LASGLGGELGGVAANLVSSRASFSEPAIVAICCSSALGAGSAARHGWHL